ncbi:MAG: ATP-binding protein [Bacteroidales bacterium]
MRKKMNPFIIKGYAGPEFFCDREEETDRLLNAINNQRNLTLVSLRKMGKTGLIYHTFEKLSKDKYDKIYIDIFDTVNLTGFINKFASSLLSLKKTFGEKMIEYIESFRYIRPVISIDPLSGLPTASFKISSEEEAQQTISDLFKILVEKSLSKSIVLAIDEFQQITKYPEKNVEALIRGNIQNLHNVTIIFSGSNKSLLGQIFSNPSRPFYQSTELMYLEEIQPPSYIDFIRNIFLAHETKIDDEAIGDILYWTRVHTYYVQYCCNKIFELKSGNISRAETQKICNQILRDHEPFYFELRNLLTHHQWQLLKAIAKEKGAKSITSSAFIKQYDLTNASTIKRGIESLLEKELIYRSKNQYLLQDVFFSRWLELQE